VSPEISVIVLNWNGRKLLGPCLEAVFAQQDADFEVIVVDNASTD
jgi:glycosyltransferase involved in cell wall biosynthesis